MTETKPTLEEMYEQLILDYDETMHEEEEYYNPEGYEQYLDGLSDDELTELYNDKYGDDY